MPTTLKIAASQAPTLPTLTETLAALRKTTQEAAAQDISIILFPEAYLGGYPRTCSFGAAVGARTDEGREQYMQYHKGAVDLGDTPTGAGDAWLNRTLPVNPETRRRGDGTREFLEDVARETGVFIVTGVVERTGGSLFCAALFIDPVRGVLGKRRKVMPTGSERLVWSQGTASTLKVVTTTIKGVRIVMGCAICWENMMPLLRYSLYSQGVNLWLAPTADARDSWGSLIRTIAMEGRCFVLSANQCQKRSELPSWITGEQQSQRPKLNESAISSSTSSAPQYVSPRRKSIATKDNHEICWPSSKSADEQPTSTTATTNGDTALPSHTNAYTTTTTKDTSTATTADPEASSDPYVSRGGSCLAGPLGTFIVPPLWENSSDLIVAEVDFEDCARGKLDFDATGHYSRSDLFQLRVEGLELVAPP